MPIKNDEETYKQVIEMGRNNDYTTGNLLDYEYFSKHYKLIAIDLSKQIELEDPDLKQQINFNVINDQNNADYGDGDENGTTIKFETKVIKSNLCDYSEAYILVTGNITATVGDANTRVAFKNCAPFTECITHINNEHVIMLIISIL